MTSSARATEADISLAVLRIAAMQPDGVATFDLLRQEIPSCVALTEEDRRISETRPNEEMCEQIVRNIQPHSKTSGNIIFGGYADHVPGTGYQITESGRRYLKAKGYLP